MPVVRANLTAVTTTVDMTRNREKTQTNTLSVSLSFRFGARLILFLSSYSTDARLRASNFATMLLDQYGLVDVRFHTLLLHRSPANRSARFFLASAARTRHLRRHKQCRANGDLHVVKEREKQT